MTLRFLNQTRSFEPSRGRVRFWGYDGTFEVCFLLEHSALEKLDPASAKSEPECLRTFDRFRDKILETAAAIYRGTGKSTYTLATSNF